MEGSNIALLVDVDNIRIGLHFGCAGAVPFAMKQPGAGNLISDTSGNILFYISSTEIYDSNGAVIAKFDSSKNYGVLPLLIIPHPAHNDEYYIFYANYTNNQLNNAIQHYCLYNTRSKTISKKDSFVANLQFCDAIKHRNKKYYWVTYTNDTANLYAFLIDSNGFHKNAIVSHFSPIFTLPTGIFSSYSYYNYKYSPDGNKLYWSIYLNKDTNLVRSLDFDNITGSFSNQKDLIPYPSYNSSEIGFMALSPDSKKLYLGSTCDIGVDCPDTLFQYDLSDNDPKSIVKSKIMISKYVSAMFQGADAKIYASGENQFYVGFVAAINIADSLGVKCNYVIENALPHNFLENFNFPFLTRQGFWPSFSIDTDTYNAFVLHFSYNDPRSGQKYKWNFGDIASGQLNHDTGAFVSHTYPFGTNTIRLVVTDQYGYDEVFKRAICINSPFVHRVHDTVICAGSSITLNSGNPASTHLWSTGDTTQQVTLSNAGKYWVRFQFHNLQETDSFTIKYDHSHDAHNFLPRDTTICEGNPVSINLDSIHGIITWQDSVVSKTFTISQTGLYHANLQNACGNYKDSIHVTAIPCNTGNINVFPNPFDNIVQIQIELSKASNVQIKVYDAIGRYITTIADAQQSTEIENYTFNAEKYNLACGVYFIKIVIDDKVYVRPVVRD